MNIILALLIFSLLIIIHEFGHFLIAKKNGITVTEFSVGMGPRLFSFDRKGTKYSLKIFPIGGSCMMLGQDELVEDKGAFNKKPVWARISTIAAGPIFNFLLAFLLSMFIVGFVGYDPAVLLEVKDGSPAQEAGLQEGDIIKKINGTKINLGREVRTYFQFNPASEQTLKVTYERDGKKMTTVIQPKKRENYLLGFSYMPSEAAAQLESVTKNGAMEQAGLKAGDIIQSFNGEPIENGLALSQYLDLHPLTGEPVQVTYERNGESISSTITPIYGGISYDVGMTANIGKVKTDIWGIFQYSAYEVKYVIVTTVKSLGQLVTGKLTKDDIAGPVGVVSMIGDTYEKSKEDGIFYVLLNMANISILLSANLGVMNLLPIPALDGGRLLFLLIEVFRGKPIDQEKEGLVHLIGLVALMILMVLVMFNDISRLLS